MSYEIIGNILKTSEFKVNFEHNIEKVILHNDIFIVLLNGINERGELRKDVVNNIYGLSSEGETIWRIEDPKNINSEIPLNTPETFTDIIEKSSGNFLAIARWKTRYIFDYKNGSMNYKTIGNMLKTASFEARFDLDVKEVILYNNTYIVLIGTNNMSESLENNIYGVNIHGEIIWRIQDPRVAYQNNNLDSVFVGVAQNSDGVFTARTFITAEYIFDYRTGVLLENKPVHFW